MNLEASSSETEPIEDSVWWLWRQDTHGNQYRMPTRYDSPDQAEEAREEYTEKGHHQTYFVKETTPGDVIDFIPASE